MNNYLKGIVRNHYSLKTEEELVELINYINKESYNLYCEILDLNKKSSYKNEILAEKINCLNNLLKQVDTDSLNFKQLQKIDKIFSDGKYYTKTVLIGLWVMLLCYHATVLAISGMLFFFAKADDKHDNEIKEIENKANSFESEKINSINNLLINCERLLSNKGKNLEVDDQIANTFISEYLNGTNIRLDFISDDILNIMINILKTDLNSNDNDINNLLLNAKENQENTMSLIKKYKK